MKRREETGTVEGKGTWEVWISQEVVTHGYFCHHAAACIAISIKAHNLVLFFLS